MILQISNIAAKSIAMEWGDVLAIKNLLQTNQAKDFQVYAFVYELKWLWYYTIFFPYPPYHSRVLIAQNYQSFRSYWSLFSGVTKVKWQVTLVVENTKFVIWWLALDISFRFQKSSFLQILARLCDDEIDVWTKVVDWVRQSLNQISVHKSWSVVSLATFESIFASHDKYVGNWKEQRGEIHVCK